jgi:hypothetical protein
MEGLAFPCDPDWEAGGMANPCAEGWVCTPIEGKAAPGICWHFDVDQPGTTFQFRKMEFVSVVPMVKEGDHYVRQCEGQATSLLLNVNLIGSQRDDGDRDVSMRPGDVVKTYSGEQRFALIEGQSIKESQFELNIECLEPYPDPDLKGNAECQGIQDPGSVQRIAPSVLRYVTELPGRTFGQADKLGVAILADQSGSIKGFVDKDSKIESSPNPDNPPWDPMNFAKNGSDPNNLRIPVMKDLLKSLNPNDKVIVFQFSENVSPTPKAVCANPDGLGEEALRSACYGTNRELITGASSGGQSELDKLQALTKGRTPLWAAVLEVYEFMQNVPKTEVRHILVISDGPDTCAPDSPDYNPAMGGLCSTTGYTEFRTRVLADFEQPDLPRVHVNFIQFQAPGYRERDPRQQEAACLTGGQYVFVNSEDLSKDTNQVLYEALRDAFMKIRYTFAGVWTLAIDVPELMNPKLGKGLEASVKGSITLKGAPDSISAVDQVLSLRIGMSNAPISGLNTLDLRGAIRLPCGTVDECFWYKTSASECQTNTCQKDTAVCGPEGKADETKCNADKGVCCFGTCMADQGSCQAE